MAIHANTFRTQVLNMQLVAHGNFVDSLFLGNKEDISTWIKISEIWSDKISNSINPLSFLYVDDPKYSAAKGDCLAAGVNNYLDGKIYAVYSSVQMVDSGKLRYQGLAIEIPEEFRTTPISKTSISDLSFEGLQIPTEKYVCF